MLLRSLVELRKTSDVHWLVYFKSLWTHTENAGWHNFQIVQIKFTEITEMQQGLIGMITYLVYELTLDNNVMHSLCLSSWVFNCTDKLSCMFRLNSVDSEQPIPILQIHPRAIHLDINDQLNVFLYFLFFYCHWNNSHLVALYSYCIRVTHSQDDHL